MELIDSERLDILRMLAEDDAEFLNTVIDAYLPQLKKAPTDLRAAQEAGDVDKIISTAHSLKGSSSNLGAAAVGELCLQIEHQAREGVLDGIDDLISKLEPVARDTHAYFVAARTS